MKLNNSDTNSVLTGITTRYVKLSEKNIRVVTSCNSYQIYRKYMTQGTSLAGLLKKISIHNSFFSPWTTCADLLKAIEKPLSDWEEKFLKGDEVGRITVEVYRPMFALELFGEHQRIFPYQYKNKVKNEQK